MVWLHLFNEERKVFGLRLYCQKKFARLKISDRTKMKLVCWPPTYLEKLLSEYMIPKEILKNIYNRLVLFGVVPMKIYFQGN